MMIETRDRDIDMMSRGELRGDDALGLPTFNIATREDVYKTMDALDPSGKATQKLKDYNALLIDKWDAHCMYGFSDIIPLASPMMHKSGSIETRVPPPTEYCATILNTKECFVVFHERLGALLDEQGETKFPASQAKWAWSAYEELKRTWNKWEHDAVIPKQYNDDDFPYLKDVHKCYEETTIYFTKLNNEQGLSYTNLMAAHISQAVNYWGDAWHNFRTEAASRDFGPRWLEIEASHLYFEYLPGIVQEMKERGFEGEARVVQEAWFMMMLRAFCWCRLHDLGKGEQTMVKCVVGGMEGEAKEGDDRSTWIFPYNRPDLIGLV